MRARCSITQRLFCEILKAWQISTVSISSISRSMNTSPTRAGSLERQSLNVPQNSARSIRGLISCRDNKVKHLGGRNLLLLFATCVYESFGFCRWSHSSRERFEVWVTIYLYIEQELSAVHCSPTVALSWKQILCKVWPAAPKELRTPPMFVDRAAWEKPDRINIKSMKKTRVLILGGSLGAQAEFAAFGSASARLS